MRICDSKVVLKQASLASVVSEKAKKAEIQQASFPFSNCRKEMVKSMRHG